MVVLGQQSDGALAVDRQRAVAAQCGQQGLRCARMLTARSRITGSGSPTRSCSASSYAIWCRLKRSTWNAAAARTRSAAWRTAGASSGSRTTVSNPSM
jgi:hypothetical protein